MSKLPFISEIKIKIHNHKHLKGMIEIESDELGILYCAPWETHHGMQANFEADSPEYQKLFELCTVIERTVREIEKLYDGTKEKT